MYEGETHLYAIEGSPYWVGTEWSCDNGEILMSDNNVALVFFENVGSSQIRSFSWALETGHGIQESFKVTVKDFSDEIFLNDLRIFGPSEPDLNIPVTYQLSNSYRDWVLDEITWSVDGLLAATSASLKYTFNSNKAYIVECSGTYYNLINARTVKFQKQMTVLVGGIYIDGPQRIENYDNVTFTIPALPTNATVKWHLSYNSMHLRIVSQTYNSITLKRLYKADVQATLNADVSVNNYTRNLKFQLVLPLINRKDDVGIKIYHPHNVINPKDNKLYPFSHFEHYRTNILDLTGFNFCYSVPAIYNNTPHELNDKNMSVLFEWNQDGKLVHMVCPLMHVANPTSDYKSWVSPAGNYSTQEYGVPARFLPRISNSSTSDSPAYTYVSIWYNNYNLTGMAAMKILRKSGHAPSSGWVEKVKYN